MTDTITETSELLHVDPATLVIGTNVRTDTHPDAKEFAKSIHERGVLEVITAHRDEAGDLVVLRGQRRTVVATEIGTPTGTVPVRVISAPDEADRIVDQMAENLHREAMQASEVLAGVEQLALIGVSAAQIAKRTAIKRTDVDAALVVAKSETIREQMTNDALTLEQAALFAEFEGDERATERLQSAVQFGRPIVHVAQQLRDAAAERAALLVEVERLRAEGLPALDPDDVPPSIYRLRLEDLRDSDDNPIAEDSWPTVEGAAVVIETEWVYPDVNDDDDEIEAEAEGVREFVPVWIVTDPSAAGLHHKYDSSNGTAPTEPSDAEREQAKAERRQVIENNKAWRSAEIVRRDWMRGFITTKSVPSGAEAIICEAVVGCDYRLSKALDRRHPLLRTLLGEDSAGYGADGCQRLATAPKTPKAHTIRTLAAILVAWEESTGVHTWRSPSAWDARIMAAITGWGYQASEVETLLVATPTA